MKNVRLLDCTLRDGGRIIDCKFPDKEISDITRRLGNANIDIIEVGFLRDGRHVNYNGNSTFFTKCEQIEKFIDRNSKCMYTAFADYGLFDFDSLEEYDEKKVDGIRVGFTKKNLDESKEQIVHCLKGVKDKGYRLYIQGVNSLEYKDRELLELVDLVNSISPYSFGMVDTYGAMYIDDVQRIYNLIDHNLNPDVCINFHSHNNFQLSFSFAQEIIRLSRGNRKIIIDATLNGMGKCAGNLNTELIVDYMNRKLGCNYDYDMILDLIDEYIYEYKKDYVWGYSVPAVMSGVYRSHPNNVIYLTDKFRLASKDIKYILSMIDAEKRQRYDYDNIRELYKRYNHTKVNDEKAVLRIKTIWKDKEILLVFPGKSSIEQLDRIRQFIKKYSPVIIPVNFVPDFLEFSMLPFFGSEKRYKKFIDSKYDFIVASNIRSVRKKDMIINYESIINRENEDFDNTGIMLFNFLKRAGRQKFYVAGFDGFSKHDQNYVDKDSFGENRYKSKFDRINVNLIHMLQDYANGMEKKSDIKFITESQFADIFQD